MGSIYNLDGTFDAHKQSVQVFLGEEGIGIKRLFTLRFSKKNWYRGKPSASFKLQGQFPLKSGASFFRNLYIKTNLQRNDLKFILKKYSLYK